MANRNERTDFDRTANLVIENAEVTFLNFRGIDYGKNPKHERSFALVIDPERFDIEAMKADGWNVKVRPPKEGYEDAGDLYYLPITVRWDNYPPSIYLVTRAGGTDEKPKYRKTRLDEESSFMIDTAKIANINVEISHGRTYEFNGRIGIKAYLKKMYVEIEEDRLDSMYNWCNDDDDEDDPF